ncbi:MAG: NapC/NirT family cytochrome c, partial [Armatimonadota bacterium]|nr:NapC/NirT family cytochrome c [Armatimonadota bacterium]
MRAWSRALSQRLRAWPRPLAVGVLVLGLGVVAAGFYGVARGVDYTMNDPNFCRSCHIMEPAWDRWQASEHRKVNCH